MIVVLALVGAGCSGINAGQSISPATFLLPGLLKVDPPPSQTPAGPIENSVEVATVR